MSDLMMIFTDLPLSALNLNCLMPWSKYSWKVGDSLIDKHSSWALIQRIYPDLYMYSSDYPLNLDMLELASEYLDRGRQIIFVPLQLFNYPPREDMVEWTIDITDLPPKKMPIVDGKVLEPELFNRYKFVKTQM